MSALRELSEGQLLPPLDAEPGPALPISDAAADALISAALERALVAPVPIRQRSWRLPWMLALAAMVMAGSAWGVFGGGNPWGAQVLRGDASVSSVVSTASAAVGRAAAATASTPTQTETPTAPSARVAASEPASDSARDPTPVPAEGAATKAPPAGAGSAPAPTAEDLLKNANLLRGQGRWQDSERAYAAILNQYPRSRQAYVATLAAASLRLEHLGDAAGALRLYQGVLRGGSLSEEALYGSARCHRALGNSTAEAAALRQLVELHPKSFLGEVSRKRLSELQ